VTVYSVYARDGDLPAAIADRFRWSAALLPPVHALAHRVWSMLALWVAGTVAIVVSSLWIGGGAGFWLYLLFATWFGFAAPQFQTRALARRGFHHLSEIIAADEDHALLTWLSRK
jgi:hypothetical protein